MLILYQSTAGLTVLLPPIWLLQNSHRFVFLKLIRALGVSSHDIPENVIILNLSRRQDGAADPIPEANVTRTNRQYSLRGTGIRFYRNESYSEAPISLR